MIEVFKAQCILGFNVENLRPRDFHGRMPEREIGIENASVKKLSVQILYGGKSLQLNMFFTLVLDYETEG